jgi:hypothetical protein
VRTTRDRARTTTSRRRTKPACQPLPAHPGAATRPIRCPRAAPQAFKRWTPLGTPNQQTLTRQAVRQLPRSLRPARAAVLQPRADAEALLACRRQRQAVAEPELETKAEPAARSPQLQERMRPARALAAALLVPAPAQVGRKRTALRVLETVARRAALARVRPPGRLGSGAPAVAALGRVQARQLAATQRAPVAAAAPARSHQLQAPVALALAAPPPIAAEVVRLRRPERAAQRGHRAAAVQATRS